MTSRLCLILFLVALTGAKPKKKRGKEATAEFNVFDANPLVNVATRPALTAGLEIEVGQMEVRYQCSPFETKCKPLDPDYRVLFSSRPTGDPVTDSIPTFEATVDCFSPKDGVACIEFITSPFPMEIEPHAKSLVAVQTFLRSIQALSFPRGRFPEEEDGRPVPVLELLTEYNLRIEMAGIPEFTLHFGDMMSKNHENNFYIVWQKASPYKTGFSVPLSVQYNFALPWRSFYESDYVNRIIKPHFQSDSAGDTTVMKYINQSQSFASSYRSLMCHDSSQPLCDERMQQQLEALLYLVRMALYMEEDVDESKLDDLASELKNRAGILCKANLPDLVRLFPPTMHKFLKQQLTLLGTDRLRLLGTTNSKHTHKRWKTGIKRLVDSGNQYKMTSLHVPGRTVFVQQCYNRKFVGEDYFNVPRFSMTGRWIPLYLTQTSATQKEPTVVMETRDVTAVVATITDMQIYEELSIDSVLAMVNQIRGLALLPPLDNTVAHSIPPLASLFPLFSKQPLIETAPPMRLLTLLGKEQLTRGTRKLRWSRWGRFLFNVTETAV